MTNESEGLYPLKPDASLGEEHGQEAVTPYECIAIQALRADGRTIGDIAFMLERSEWTVIRHASEDCGHEVLL